MLPPFLDRSWSADAAAQQRHAASLTDAAVLERLRPGEVAMTAPYWPNGDSRYYDEVQDLVTYTPPYPYRFLPQGHGADWAPTANLRPAYYVGFDAPSRGTVDLAPLGTFALDPLPDAQYGAQLVPPAG